MGWGPCNEFARRRSARAPRSCRRAGWRSRPPARRPPVTLGCALTVARLLRGLVHSATGPRDLAPLRPRQRGARGPLGVIVGEPALHSGAPREPALRALLPVMRVHSNKILPFTRDTVNGPRALCRRPAREAPLCRKAHRGPRSRSLEPERCSSTRAGPPMRSSTRAGSRLRASYNVSGNSPAKWSEPRGRPTGSGVSSGREQWDDDSSIARALIRRPPSVGVRRRRGPACSS